MNSLSFIDSLNSALLLVWQEIIIYTPLVLVALLVFVLGLIVAKGLGSLVEKLLMATKLDQGLAKTGLRTFFDRAGMQLNSARFFGELVRWFIILAFLMAAADILKLTAVTGAIERLLFYFPKVVVAAVVMIVTLFFANVTQKLVKSAISGANLKNSGFVSALAKWAVLIFGLLIALRELQIAVDIINILFTGLVAMLAISGGLAFGLGGKDFAQDLLAGIRRDVEER
ncbi:MAG: hypothetical protein AB1721_00055 [Patescibacteria group bacterium]